MQNLIKKLKTFNSIMYWKTSCKTKWRLIFDSGKTKREYEINLSYLIYSINSDSDFNAAIF